MSFLRSVIVMKPSSSISAMSPVRSQPSLVEHLAGRLLVLVVAGEDGLAADRAARRPRRASPRRPGAACRRCRTCSASGTVDRAGGRALGQPVALEDQQVEGVEELASPRARAARRRRSRSAAGRRAAPSPSSRRAGRRAGAGARASAGSARRPGGGGSTSRPTRERPLARAARFGPASPRRAGDDGGVDLLVDPRHAREDGRPDLGRGASPTRSGSRQKREREARRRRACRWISRPKLWASGR